MNAPIYLNKRFCVFSFALCILFVVGARLSVFIFVRVETVIQNKTNNKENDEQMNGDAAAAVDVAVAMLPINTLEKYFHCKQLYTLLYRMNF